MANLRFRIIDSLEDTDGTAESIDFGAVFVDRESGKEFLVKDDLVPREDGEHQELYAIYEIWTRPEDKRRFSQDEFRDSVILLPAAYDAEKAMGEQFKAECAKEKYIFVDKREPGPWFEFVDFLQLLGDKPEPVHVGSIYRDNINKKEYLVRDTREVVRGVPYLAVMTVEEIFLRPAETILEDMKLFRLLNADERMADGLVSLIQQACDATGRVFHDRRLGCLPLDTGLRFAFEAFYRQTADGTDPEDFGVIYRDRLDGEKYLIMDTDAGAGDKVYAIRSIEGVLSDPGRQGEPWLKTLRRYLSLLPAEIDAQEAIVAQFGEMCRRRGAAFEDRRPRAGVGIGPAAKLEGELRKG